MAMESLLMVRNMVSPAVNEPSRYVKESLAIRDMEKAATIDQGKMVSSLARKAPDARTVAAIRSAKAETYTSNAVLGPSAHEMAVGLVRAEAAREEAKAEDGSPLAGSLNVIV
ncbi:MAG: hypothetical protein LIP28_10605 [Deltaproteobacteria bacterium]|nr:hypothetical protein [Deltaproteobacteria bacterium]